MNKERFDQVVKNSVVLATRYVVTDDTIVGKPVYVAADEKDAALFLDEKEQMAKLEGQTTDRQNSLTLYVRGKSNYTYRVFAVPSSV